MAHVHAYGDVCPEARAIIHLGATSCYVTDNTDLMLMRESLELVRGRLVAVIDRPGRFRPRSIATCLAWPSPICSRPSPPPWASGPACGPTTWCWTWPRSSIASRSSALGSKGTTGTQASFLELFQRRPRQGAPAGASWSAARWALPQSIPSAGRPIRGRSTPRCSTCCPGMAQSAHKAATDLRLLQHRKEVEEPFEDRADRLLGHGLQAQPDAERADLLAGPVRHQPGTAAPPRPPPTQWLERTLDDSANRRLVLPQAFLAVDAVLLLVPERGRRAGGLSPGDRRQPGGGVALHGHREHPDGGRGGRRRPAGVARADSPPQPGGRRGGQAARRAATICWSGWRPIRPLPRWILRRRIDPAKFVGRAPEQVDEFLAEVVEPIRAKYPQALAAARGNRGVERNSFLLVERGVACRHDANRRVGMLEEHADPRLHRVTASNPPLPATRHLSPGTRHSSQTPVTNMRWPDDLEIVRPGHLVADPLQLCAVELDELVADLAVEMVVAGIAVVVLVDAAAAEDICSSRPASTNSARVR